MALVSLTLKAKRMGTTNYKPIDGLEPAPIEEQRKGWSIELATPEDEAKAEALGMTVYTPEATEEEPHPSNFIRATSSQLVKIFNTVTGRITKEVFHDDMMPNIELKNVTFEIIKGDKQGNDFYRVSSLLIDKKVEVNEMINNPFELDMTQFSTAEKLEAGEISLLN